jgi:hypothetical protein
MYYKNTEEASIIKGSAEWATCDKEEADRPRDHDGKDLWVIVLQYYISLV